MDPNPNPNPNPLLIIPPPIPTALAVPQLLQYIQNHPLSTEVPLQIKLSFGYKQKLTDPRKTLSQTFQINNLMNLNLGKIQNQCTNSLQDRLYICYDCQVVSQGFLCEKCFFTAGHHKHCRYQIKELDENLKNVYTCACGDYTKMNFKGTCGEHHKLSTNAPVCKVQKQMRQKLINYVAGCFKLLIISFETLHNLKIKFQKSDELCDFQSFIYWTYQSKLFTQLSASIKRSAFYSEIIQCCLLQRISQQHFQSPHPNPTILTCLLSKILRLYDKFMKLLEDLLQWNSKQFIFILIQDALLTKDNYSRQKKLLSIQNYKNNGRLRPDLLCEALDQVWRKHGDIAFEQSNFAFFANFTSPAMSLHKEDKKILCILPYWEYLQSKDKLTIQKILQTHTTSILSIISNTTGNSVLFSSLIKKLIKYTYQKAVSKYIKKNETGRNINLTQMCNLISKLILTYLEGNYNQIPVFLHELNLNEWLCFLSYHYFNQTINNCSQMSQQTIYFIGIFLGNLVTTDALQYSNYLDMWTGEDKNITAEKMIDFMAKSLNIIFGQELKYLAKISTYRQLIPQQRQIVEKRQQQKLKQLLYMQKKIPRKQVQILLKENIFCFSKAAEILKNYTEYDQKSSSFVYNSKQNNFHFDGIFNALFDLNENEVNNLIFDPQILNNQTDQNLEIRKCIIEGIMRPLLQNAQKDIYKKATIQTNKNGYKVVKSQFEYVKYICLITIDKYVSGKVVNLRNYLLNKRQKFRQLLQSSPNFNITKLIKIFVSEAQCDSYSKQLSKQELMTNNQSNLLPSENTKISNEQKSQQSLGQSLATNQAQIKTELSNIQPKQQQKPSSQQSIPQSTPSTPNSKLLKLQQKFRKKQQSILNLHISGNSTPIKENAETCMTCKEEGHPDNALFYLGSLKKSGQQCKIFQSAYRTDYTANLCMHLIHEKCFLKICPNNTVNCPLCRSTSNVVFPHQEQQLSAKSFQFFENRLTYTLVSVYQEYHQDRCFIFMLKTVISEILFEIISSVLLLGSDSKQVYVKNISKQQSKKKVKYYLELIKKWWGGLQQCQKQTQLLKLTRQFTDIHKGNMMDSESKNPKIILDLLVKTIIWSRIDNNSYHKQIDRLLSQLQELMELKQIEYLLKKLQQISLQQITFIPSGKNKSNKNFLDYYMTPPSYLYNLQKQKKCEKCIKVNPLYFCLLCNINYCTGCNHQKTHDNIYARIDCSSGEIQTKGKTKDSSSKIYFNDFCQGWRSVTYGHDDYFAYKISNAAVGKAVTEWVRNMYV